MIFKSQVPPKALDQKLRKQHWTHKLAARLQRCRSLAKDPEPAKKPTPTIELTSKTDISISEMVP
jgi:hypothetical protein